MEELELELKVVVAEVDTIIDTLRNTPKRSNDYNYLVGKLEAYTDVQNLIMCRLSQLRKETKK